MFYKTLTNTILLKASSFYFFKIKGLSKVAHLES